MPTVYLEDEILNLFRNKTFEKHGKLYGHLRDEFRAAVLTHINNGMPEVDVHKLAAKMGVHLEDGDEAPPKKKKPMSKKN